jgi:ribosomal protein S18 acetylase RimI-like enzyme
MLALGHEVFDADGARFVRDRRLPDIWEANRISTVTAATPEAIDRLLARAEREYDGLEHRRFDLDVTTPPGVEARLLLEGYRARDFLVMVLEGPWHGRAIAADIRPCADDDAWAAYVALKREDWREAAQRLGLSEGSVGAEMADSHRRRCPPARYWLAWADGAPRGFISSWEGIDGLGQVEDLFVQRQARGRGLAAALIRHGVAECRRAGADPVVIVADADDTPRLAYARMGFRPVAATRAYLKIVTPPGAASRR